MRQPIRVDLTSNPLKYYQKLNPRAPPFVVWTPVAMIYNNSPLPNPSKGTIGGTPVVSGTQYLNLRSVHRFQGMWPNPGFPLGLKPVKIV